jgi:hypothetical protein
MGIVTSAESREFIKTARFRAASTRVGVRAVAVEDTPPLDLKATEAQSLVVGSGLMVAAKDVPVQAREDIINCMLFAQLAASGEVGDSTDVTKWYDAYFRALTVLGWAQSDTHFEDYSFKSTNVEAHRAILKVIAMLMGPQAAAIVVVKAAIDALQSMNENSPWITLFDSQSKVGSSARFQVAAAQLEKNGQLQVALCAFNLKARSTFAQVLFFRFQTSSTRLKYAAGKATIYEAALKDQRAALAARLAAYRSQYIGEVKFPPVSPPAGDGRRKPGLRARGRPRRAR